MNCPNCGGKLHVLDVRQDINTNETCRKKECYDCHYIVFTREYEVKPGDVNKFKYKWNALDRSNHNQKIRKQHKCFGRYLDISPACAECKWQKECLEKSKE